MMETRNRVLEIGLPAIVCLFVGFIIGGAIYTGYRSGQNNWPVIGEEITAEELIPWTGEEEDSLRRAPLEFLLDPPGLKKRVEVGGRELVLYLFYPEEEEGCYEYFGRRGLGGLGLLESFSLWDSLAVVEGVEVYVGEKDGEQPVYLSQEEFSEAFERLGRIIPLPE